MHAAMPAVSGVTSRDHIAWAADNVLQRDGVNRYRRGGHRPRLGAAAYDDDPLLDLHRHLHIEGGRGTRPDLLDRGMSRAVRPPRRFAPARPTAGPRRAIPPLRPKQHHHPARHRHAHRHGWRQGPAVGLTSADPPTTPRGPGRSCPTGRLGGPSTPDRYGRRSLVS